MRRILTILTLALAAAALLAIPAAAGGGGHGTAACLGFGEGDTIVMRDNCFEGVGHLASAGTITVTNEGQLPHTLTAIDDSFDTGILEAGESATIELDAAGTYPVYCTLHGSAAGNGMAGLITVAAPGDSPAAASDATSETASEDTTVQGPGLLGGMGWAAFLLTVAGLTWARRRRTEP